MPEDQNKIHRKPIDAIVAIPKPARDISKSLLPKVADHKKRSFLKLASVVGVGTLASMLLPKRAQAYVLGSSPTSGVVGLKDSSNTRINPATETTLAGIKTQTDLLTFDSGTNPANLKVNIASIANTADIGLINVANTPINPATEDSLAVVKTQLNKLTFDGSSNLLTASSGAAGTTGLKDTTGTQINPATDDSIIYLRRMVKLMESQAAVDSSNRQRVAVESAVISSGTVTTVSTVSTVSAVTNISAVAGWGDQMFQDVARNAYANGIRQNLTFS